MDQAEIGEGTSGPTETEPAPRRNPLSRLSFGHVIMIAAGLLAFLLNVALLRSSDESVQVLVAGNDISAGSRLVAADIGSVFIVADSPFIGRVVSPETVNALLGQIVMRDISEGSPLLADDMRASAAPGRRKGHEYPDRAVPGGGRRRPPGRSSRRHLRGRRGCVIRCYEPRGSCGG